jgi:hypothetical protein
MPAVTELLSSQRSRIEQVAADHQRGVVEQQIRKTTIFPDKI